MKNPKALFDSIIDPAGDPRLDTLGNGLINNTFLVLQDEEYYVAQNLNTHVFCDPEILENNISLASAVLKRSGVPFTLLNFIEVAGGKLHYTVNGITWRAMEMIEDTDCFERITDLQQAENAAFALGSFHAAFTPEDALKFKEPIPHFTDFSLRWKTFEDALENGIPGRLEQYKDLTDFFLSNKTILDTFVHISKSFPLRVIHGDPKASNFLFESQETTVKSIIDWDTLMPGTVLYDFGDMVRSFTNYHREDELSENGYFNRELYDSLYKGYVNSPMGTLLTPQEKESFALASQVVVYVQALRFFTDFLRGDEYYKTNYGDHNLVRAKNQLGLLEGMMNF